jgi:cysteine-rich repeat protein
MNRRLSKTRAIAVFTGLGLLLGVGSASAANTVDGCLATIAKEAQGFAKKKSTALRKCEDGVLKGKVTGPCPDTKNADKISAAMAKAEANIAKKCAGLEGVGPSGACTAAGVPDACCTGDGTGGCFPLNIGYGANCPRPECVSNLGDETDVATCVACNVEVLVDDLNGAAYGSLTAPSAEKTTLNCQRTFGKEIMGAFAKIGKAKQKCEDGRIKGKVPSCPDAKTTEKIGKSLTKIADKINKKCGGGAIDDAVKPAALAGNFGTQAGVGPRVEAVAEAQVQSSISEAACGDAIAQAGETCDDGNNYEDDGTGPLDNCPASCVIGPCAAPFGSQTATVSFDQGSAAVGLTGLTVVVRYNDAKVAIPGSGSDANVSGAVLPAGSFSITPGDTNYALRGVLIDSFFAGVPSGTAFTIDFDTCNGAPAPTAADFSCAVADAADENLAAVTDATCTVSVP